MLVDEIAAAALPSCSDDHGLMVNGLAEQYFERKRKLSYRQTALSDRGNQSADEAIFADLPLKETRELFAAEDSSRLPAEQQAEFAKWMLYLSEDFNLLLHGYGSKVKLLEKFCEAELKDEYSHFVIRGYLPHLSLSKALEALARSLGVELVRGSRPSALQIVGQIRNARRRLDEPKLVIVIVHSLDAMVLRSRKHQSAIFALSTVPGVSMVMTIDHRNGAALIDKTAISRGNFVWVEASTLLSYHREIMAGESKVLGFSKRSSDYQHSLASLACIWSSLTSKSRAALVHFVRMALTSRRQLVPFWDWYRRCLDDFVVSNEMALNQHLVEFQDHRLIKAKTNTDGSSVLRMEVDGGLMELFLKQQGVDMDESAEAE